MVELGFLKTFVARQEVKLNYSISTQRQNGASLIEVLISIFVLAVGLLGLASLQVNAMKFEKSSSQRAEASQATYDLSERMRANFVDQATTALTYSYLTNYATSHAAAHSPPNTCNVADCTTEMIAANDMAEWLRSLQRRISGGTGYVAVVPGASVLTFDIAIMWNEQGLSVLDPACPAGAAAPVGVRCFVTRVMP